MGRCEYTFMNYITVSIKKWRSLESNNNNQLFVYKLDLQGMGLVDTRLIGYT